MCPRLRQLHDAIMPSFQTAYKYRAEIAHERKKAQIREYLAYFEVAVCIAAIAIILYATWEYLLEQDIAAQRGDSGLLHGGGWAELGAGN